MTSTLSTAHHSGSRGPTDSCDSQAPGISERFRSHDYARDAHRIPHPHCRPPRRPRPAPANPHAFLDPPAFLHGLHPHRLPARRPRHPSLPLHPRHTCRSSTVRFCRLTRNSLNPLLFSVLTSSAAFFHWPFFFSSSLSFTNFASCSIRNKSAANSL